MSRRTTMVLGLVLFALLAGSYALSEQQRAAPATPVSAYSAPWLQLTGGPISSISILDTTSGQRLQASLDAAGNWLLQAPITGAADAQQLDAWLGQWQFMYAQHTLTPTASLDEFGLATPALIMTFTQPSGQATAIHVGNSAPAVSGYYARQAGSAPDGPIAVISKWPVDQARGFLSAPPLQPTAAPAP